MKCNLRLAAAHRGIWTASEMQRMLAARGLAVSAGKMPALWSGSPASVKLSELDVICALTARAVRAVVIPVPLGSFSQQIAEAVCEQIGVTGPAGGQVPSVPDDESRGVIGRGTARGQRQRATAELAVRVIQAGPDLILDVSGIGPVVASEPPCRGR